MPSPPSLDQCRALDLQFPTLRALASRFATGAADTVYLDANSIGPMPRDVPRRVAQVLDQGWRVARRRGWNDSDWLEQPHHLGACLAPVLGAGETDVVVCDSTSVNQYKLLRHALSIRAPRQVIVVQSDVFPSNRYVAEGVAGVHPETDRLAGTDALRLIDSIDQLPAALAPGDVAVVALSHVDYRSSERLDMAGLTRTIHEAGALALWDLSHSAGAVAIDLRAADVDLALGCGYKYLCGGPGSPGFVYVHPRWQSDVWPTIRGWMGHADTFAFEPSYRPARGPASLLVGTPPVLANAAFGAAAEIWRQVDPRELDARHASLADTLAALLEPLQTYGLRIVSPRDHGSLGGHVATSFEAAQALANALLADRVVLSARKPDALRFGLHPITTTHENLWVTADRLGRLLSSGEWRDPKFDRASV